MHSDISLKMVWGTDSFFSRIAGPALGLGPGFRDGVMGREEGTETFLRDPSISQLSLLLL